MTNNERRELWIEMSIREIWTQCHFAEISYNNIEKKSINPTDQAFSSIHSFLSHCTMISKLLKGREIQEAKKQIRFDKFGVNILISYGKNMNAGKSIGQIISIKDSSIIHKRKFRNHLEHYDERLKEWIDKHSRTAIVRTYNIGPKSMFNTQESTYIGHYDDKLKIFTFINQDLNINLLFQEVERIKKVSDNWIKKLETSKT